MWPARVVGAIGTLAIAAAFVFAVITTLHLQDRGEEQRQVVFTAWDYVVTVGVDAKVSILVDPLSMFMALVGDRRLDADPPVLGRLPERATAATRASSRT